MDSLRADDHSTIGGILFAVLTPALFWKRANAFNCQYTCSDPSGMKALATHLTRCSLCLFVHFVVIVGGAGMGSAVGLLTHYGRSVTGDPPPQAPLPSHEAST